ncbi:hypothetical protein [Mucilaginibacter ginsenosidivorax]|uniref:Uncharacterized protein n=1 Tax=Mucilaginibacter ginsenosidivorax TaxID=862126 RepID=A0A5B8VYL8_9SPHI|nr:hypothetical protein [Mucilaginibacter ginsenosidivorax]QEC76539.1 hypothetical protein FSB76_11480 [Mucilaginibacter ginsenosidivorax]
MSTQEQIYNWLITGLQQSPVKFSEVFYYDKRDKQFFSILMTDYFLFDGNGELARDASSTYSEATLLLLTDRIRRINIDPQIIAIPRLGDTDEDYLQQADSFLNLNAINVDESTIWDVEESGSITFNLK